MNPMLTRTRTVTSDGKMVCRWVMPYERAASVSVRNLGKREAWSRLAAAARERVERLVRDQGLGLLLLTRSLF